MSIFNTGGASTGGGGLHVAEWVYSGTSANQTVSSMSFSNLDGTPTKWMLVCIGPYSGETTTTSTTSYIISIYSENGSSVKTSTCRYRSGYGARFDGYATSTPTVSVSNNTLTLSGRFRASGNTTNNPYTYYLVYMV